MVEENLRTLGFTENEITAYLSLAEIGKGAASLVAKRTNMPRTTAYSVLDSLVSKGVVSQEQRSNTTFYSANNPSCFLRMLKDEREKLQEKVDIAKCIPDIIKPYFKRKNFSIPSIKFFEGKENVENMLYDYSTIFQASALENDNTWWGFQDHTFVEEYGQWLKHHW